MFEHADSLLPLFLQAQARHLWLWLFSSPLYLLLAELLLLSLIVPAHAWSRQTAIGIAQDYLYGIVHSLLTFPLAAVGTFLLVAFSARHLAWLRLDAFADLPAAEQVLVAILVNDFLKFIWHYQRHQWRPLWHFHALHHSQPELNPLTTKRTHVAETLVTVLGINWIPFVVMGSPPEIWLAYHLLDTGWDYFIHSNLRVTLGPLKYLVVSPQYHRLHHSSDPRHIGKNFTSRLVVWDLLFGTADFDFRSVRGIGLPDATIAIEDSLQPTRLLAVFARQWWYPFRMVWADCRSGWRVSVAGDDPAEASVPGSLPVSGESAAGLPA